MMGSDASRTRPEVPFCLELPWQPSRRVSWLRSLLPPRTCGQVGNSFFNLGVVCVGVPSWVRAVVVGTAAVIACVLAAVAVGPHRSEGRPSREDSD
jgi:hypothetical protein